MTFALVDFDPSAATQGTLNVGTQDQQSKIGMINDSKYSLTITFADGSTDILPAFYSRLFPLNVATQKLTWKQRATMAAVNPPLSTVQSTLFGPRDDASSFPIGPTNRHVNTGNQLNLADQASFFAQEQLITPGVNSAMTIADITGDRMYLTGFTFTTQKTTSGIYDYQIEITGLISGAIDYFVTASTILGASHVEIFPYAIPAITSNLGLTLTVVGTVPATAGNGYLIAYGYMI